MQFVYIWIAKYVLRNHQFETMHLFLSPENRLVSLSLTPSILLDLELSSCGKKEVFLKSVVVVVKHPTLLFWKSCLF